MAKHAPNNTLLKNEDFRDYVDYVPGAVDLSDEQQYNKLTEVALADSKNKIGCTQSMDYLHLPEDRDDLPAT